MIHLNYSLFYSNANKGGPILINELSIESLIVTMIK